MKIALNAKTIAGGILLLIGLGVYVYWNHTTLEKAAWVEVQEYLETELPARAMRGMSGDAATAKLFETVQEFEIQKIDSDALFDRRASIRATVGTSKGQELFYFHFTRSFGEWKLRRTTFKRIESRYF